MYRYVYIWEVNLFTTWLKNDEFRLGWTVSLLGSQVIMTKKDIRIISKENDWQEVWAMKKIIDV